MGVKPEKLREEAVCLFDLDLRFSDTRRLRSMGGMQWSALETIGESAFLSK